MAIVTFDLAGFRARYPEFAAVADSLLGAYFNEAGLYLNNTDSSPVSNVTKRSLLLNMLVAHIATLNGALSADGQARPVGRVSQAGEGSVSASFEYSEPGSESWFVQTQYGAAYWQATLNYRRMRYIAHPTTWV